MFTKTIALLALASTLTSAIPRQQSWQAPTFGDKFGIHASGEGIYNLDVTASKGSLAIGGVQDEPKCASSSTKSSHTSATFVWNEDKTLFLYTNGRPRQQVWVDASGMGGGVSGYTTGGDKGLSKNASRKPFQIDPETRILTFNGYKTIACPTADTERTGWSIGFAGKINNAFSQNCVYVTLKAYKAKGRAACHYSEGSSIS